MENGFSKWIGLVLLAIFSFQYSVAQNQVKATALQHDIMDLSQRSSKVFDQNGERCAVIKFETPIPSFFSFNLGAQQIERRENKDDEVWIWMSPDVKKMTIRCRECTPLKDYPVNLKPGHVFRAKLTTGLPQEVEAAQYQMEVTPLQYDADDLSQRYSKVFDQNGERCALIRFETPTPSSFSFKLLSAYQIEYEIEKRENKDDEIWIWVCPDIKKMIIRCSDCTPVRYPVNLESGNVYRAKISTTLPQEKYNANVRVHRSHPYLDTIQLKPNYQPPLLALVEGSLIFKDANSNNRIDAEEKCLVTFKIVNNGKGEAMNCEARIKMTGTSNGVSVNTVKLPTIAAGNIQEVSIPVVSSINTEDGQVSLSIEVYEPNGWGIAPFDLTVATKAYDPPFLQVVDYNIASNSGKIRKMEPFTLTFNLQNTKYGDAEDVKVKVNLPNNVFVMDGSVELSYPLIKSGEVKPIQLTLAANNNYPTTNIPITIDLKEKHGKFAENKHLDIALNQTTKSSISIAYKEDTQVERKEIQLAMMTAEVDRDIPISNTKNTNTFALILANEHYQQVATVPFALNDGNIFREYCIKTLGISEKHIKYLSDATGNQLKAGINWLANLTKAFDNPQIIVYYAGHGIPDESSKTAYLLPVDGIISDMSTCYKLDDLYATLGTMPASQITVFMDACFSGSKREEGMLASARGVALKAKSGTPQGNMVVFSAAQGNETAYPNKEKQHGLFTYYLLKKLQQTEGDVSLQELGDYIITNVKQQSILLNSKLQTPCVTPSASLDASWQNWKLK